MATTQLTSLSKLVDIPIENHYDESYLIRLASMSLHELLDEPSRLEMKAESLEREIQTKAIEQNEVFEKAQSCFSNVVTKMGSLYSSVSTTCDYIPTLEYSCNSFSKEVESIYNKYNQSKKALKYHSQLLELLEMPQLMDTCIRNNLHEEGLVLLRHANTLFCEHFPNVSPSDHLTITNHTGDSVILSIFHEMVAAGEQQEAFLLRELETDITVARCVEIMSYLEQNIALRFNSKSSQEIEQSSNHVGSLLTESQLHTLKLNFFKARKQFYQKRVSSLSEFDHGEFLRGYISIFKDQCSGIISQYDAVFGTVANDIILHNYLSSEITNFITILKSHIHFVISGSILSSLFRDLINLCDSLSLIHCNFYSLLQNEMIQAVSQLMENYWNLVVGEFEKQISSSLFWMKMIYSNNLYRLKSNDAFLIHQSNCQQKDLDSLLLPDYLLEIPILAKLMNDFISTFNELRFVSIRGCSSVICKSMNSCLLRIANVLVKVHSLVDQIVVPKSKVENIISNEDHYHIIVIHFVNTIIPLIQLYLQRIFSTNEPIIEKKEVVEILKEGGVYKE